MFNKIIFLLMGTILIAANLNASWTVQHTGSGQFYDIDFPQGQLDIGCACGPSGLIYKTANGGVLWEQKQTPILKDFTGISFPTAMTGYICGGDSGIIMKTTDGGEIWEHRSVGPQVRFNAIDFPVDGNTGWACGLSGAIWFTFDGLQWASISTPEPHNFQDIYFADNLHGWVIGDMGVCYRTYNSGLTWFPCTTDVNDRLLGVHFNTLANGWIVGTSKTVLQSNDSGVHWTRVDIPSVPENVTFQSVVFPTSTDGFICGSNGWFVRTTNGGSSWEPYIINPPHTFYALEFPAGNMTGWLCGSEEVILKTTDGGAPGIEESNLKSGIIKNSLICTPNPFHANTIIKFGLPINNNATLKLYDAKGGLVRILSLNKNGEVNWDGRNELNQKVKSGVYLIELNHNGINQRQKLIFMD